MEKRPRTCCDGGDDEGRCRASRRRWCAQGDDRRDGRPLLEARNSHLKVATKTAEAVFFQRLEKVLVATLIAACVAYTLFLKRLSKVMSVPIARLQDWNNLGKIGSVSTVCALVVRFCADILNPSTPIAAIGGPAAVLVLYVIILFVTGYYRTLAKIRREWDLSA